MDEGGGLVELVFDWDEAEHYRGVPGFVRWVAGVFAEVAAFGGQDPVRGWLELLVFAPEAKRNRARWIRLAGIYAAYSPELDRSRRKELFGLLRALPEMSEREARRKLAGRCDPGVHSFHEIVSAYYAAGGTGRTEGATRKGNRAAGRAA